MTTSELIEPPLAANERETLVSFLDYFRTVLIRKAEGLTAEQLAVTVAPSSLTLGGLVVHMALVESSWFNDGFAGNDPREPWASAPWDDDRDWELTNAGTWSPQEALELLRTAIAESSKILEGAASLDQLAVRSSGDRGAPSLRWILVHMIEEYARHCGHADLLRESIDGQTGD